jgi:hypothetical protein
MGDRFAVHFGGLKFKGLRRNQRRLHETQLRVRAGFGNRHLGHMPLGIDRQQQHDVGL